MNEIRLLLILSRAAFFVCRFWFCFSLVVRLLNLRDLCVCRFERAVCFLFVRCVFNPVLSAVRGLYFLFGPLTTSQIINPRVSSLLCSPPAPNSGILCCADQMASASTSKLVLGGLASLGFGWTVWKGVSRKIQRDNLKRLLTTKSAAVTKTRYPVTPKLPVVDDYHGTKVTDNYRWLEDQDSEETKIWVTEQNRVTDAYFAQEKALRTAIGARLTETFNFERYGVPFKRGKRVFFFKNNGLQNQSVLYWYDESKQQQTAASAAADTKSDDKSLEREPTKTGVMVLLDPNSLSKDGTAALGSYNITDSGEYIAYGVARSGSDWNSISIKRVSDGFEYKEVLEWVKFSSISWTVDDKGFFYSRYPTPKAFASGDTNFARGTETDEALFQQLYYHRIGTDQSQDKLIWENPSESKWMSSGSVTDDGQYLLIYITESCDPVNRLYYAKISDLGLSDPKTKGIDSSKVVKLIDNFEAEYAAIANFGTTFFFRTNLKAPKGRVISCDLATVGSAKPDTWADVIPASADVLDSVQCVNKSFLLCSYVKHVAEVPKVRKISPFFHRCQALTHFLSCCVCFVCLAVHFERS